MDTKQEIDKYNEDVKTFVGYGRFISQLSSDGKELLEKINQKSEKFNSLTEDQRIQVMNTDPDFQEFIKIVNKLYAAYASFILFMTDTMNITSSQNSKESPVKTSTPSSAK